MRKLKVIKYHKNKHQKAFHADLESRFLHMNSGFGGGKTYSLVMKMLQLSNLNKNFDGGFIAPTFKDLRRDVLPTLEDIAYENGFTYQHHKLDSYLIMPWSKRKIWLVSAENKIRGPNWGYALINEVTLISHERYKEVIGRVRVKGCPYPVVASSGTPEGTGHWLYEKFVESPMKNSSIIYGDTRDNIENLDPHYIQALYDSYDDTMIDAYLKGLFVNMTGNRFYYSYDPDKNHDTSIKRQLHAVNHIAIDFNVDPMSASVWHYDGYGIQGFDQIKIMDGDTYKLCDALKTRGYTPSNSVIYPDPAGKARRTSGKSDVKILREYGGFYNVQFRSKAPDFRRRQLLVNNLLNKERITFNPDTMPDVKKDFAAVEQDVITLGKVKKDLTLTHMSDGIDYMTEILFNTENTKLQARHGVSSI